jgi:hypothetical protein
MNKGVVFALCSAAFFICSAQTPTPPAPALPTKALRHLEYKFDVVYMETGEGHVGGIGTGGSGVVSYDGTDGRQGTMSIDVLAAAKDGGLVVRAQESLPNAPRQQMPVTCAVYGNGEVLCGNDRTNVPSDAVAVLLAHLGRDFYNPSLIDDKGHWTRTFEGPNVRISSSFSMPKLEDGKPSAIFEHRDIKWINDTQPDLTEDTRLMYDTGLLVPTSISDEAVESSRGAGYARTRVNLTLVSDSFAKH